MKAAIRTVPSLVARLAGALWLRVDSIRPGRARRLDLFRDDEDPTQLQRWTWTTLKNPARGRIIRSVAWDADGRCTLACDAGFADCNGDTTDGCEPHRRPGLL